MSANSSLAPVGATVPALSTPVWVGDNETKSDGRTHRADFAGVAHSAKVLESDTLRVTGQAPFEPGHEPHDPHVNRTRLHDSFVQAVAYQALSRVERRWDRLSPGMTFGELVGKVVVVTGAFERVDAVFNPQDRSIMTGVAVKGGKAVLDLGADMDVVIHELMHLMVEALVPGLSSAGDAGMIQEALADGLVALITGDPEISEDLARMLGQNGGRSLRDASSQARLQSGAGTAHSQGEALLGILWDTAESIAAMLEKGPRPATTDRSLTPTAADAMLLVLWTLPLHLGTLHPNRHDFLRALRHSVARLSDAGVLPNPVNAAALDAAIVAHAKARGLATSAAHLAIGEVTSVSAGGAGGGPSNALEALELDAKAFELRLQSSTASFAGDRIDRYRLWRFVDTAAGRLQVEVADDVVTLVTDGAGSLTVQAGRLREVAGMFAAGSSGGPLAWESRDARGMALAAGSPKPRPVNPIAALPQLYTLAVAELDRQLGDTSATAANGARAKESLRDAIVALRQEPWRGAILQQRGRQLVASLPAGPVTVYAPIAADGSLGPVQLEVQASCATYRY